MKISLMIEKLQAIKEKHGDLTIVGGTIHDDTPPQNLVIINTDGCDWDHDKGSIEGVFIEG